MDELTMRPCPFCGGEATPVYCEHGSRYTSNVLYPLKKGTVKCKKCEVCLPRVYKTVARAIKVWNGSESDG